MATDLERKDDLCRIQARFNEILHEFPGNQSDTIDNISDLKLLYPDNLAKGFKYIETYGIGDIVSYRNFQYVSKTAGNIGNNPELDTTNWQINNPLTTLDGYFFSVASANIKISTSGILTIQESRNIDSIVELSRIVHSAQREEITYKVNITPNIGIQNSNYLIMRSDRSYVAGTPNDPTKIFNAMNIIAKTEISITFKIFTHYQADNFISFAIIPQQ